MKKRILVGDTLPRTRNPPEDFPDQPHPINRRYLDQQMWKLNGLAGRIEGFERRLENHREMLEHGRD